MRFVLSLLIFLAIINSVCANESVSFHVRDFNTVQPIEAVDVQVYNDTFSMVNSTDVYGNVWFVLNGTGNFSIAFSKLAYESKLIQRENLSNGTEDIFLNPQSTNGIIKLHVWDMGAHTMCIYYGVNGRLKECDLYNESGYIQIYTSTNYTFKPVLTRADLVSTPKNLIRYSGLWVPLLVGVFFVACLLALFFVLVIRLYKGRGRK